ncbi:DUF2934 domain-containing protein [Pseudomonas sp. B21-012]|uniref:DUF2934 domain-containing protein n=1 Tax=unclassified Pseudomonas TaxID=196821 RepID=UPI001BCDEAF4|nr:MULTISPECIES: DUF2934 domain-containing protein [unclassified Pseudomonas]QVM94562.1 DUF2934 domain-containing protein [Pseudomonas sp. SORT22]UVM58216.1 DUF2934 domain-containing protein [Pseudomonas sp. B21-012]
MSVEEKRIREFAYQIWESEGKPEGQEERHWAMARKLAEAEALAPKVTPRKPAKAPPASSAKAKPASTAPAPKKPRTTKKPPTA